MADNNYSVAAKLLGIAGPALYDLDKKNDLQSRKGSGMLKMKILVSY
ncbi:MAG: hypothetical protein ACJAYG_001184 [Oceanicoccus sp.]|jgi:hypothetical protein